jgi:predicted AAA+ superfamily ATPase
MLQRYVRQAVVEALARQAAVGLIGPRQVGKTTLALSLIEEFGGVYLDLESAADRAKLQDPALYFSNYKDSLVVLDEIHRMPEIFRELRGVIDQGRRKGKRNGRFLILGSASIDLLKQSSESLAGRIEYVSMTPLNCKEIPHTEEKTLWLRGGFPDSYLADSDRDSIIFRTNFIRTYLERDVPQFGPRVPAESLRRLWAMLANLQGALLNASKLAASLGVSSPTVSSYIDLLIDLLLIRRLQPYHANIKKRLVKSPKLYIRDSGLTHALLNLGTYEQLLGHPVVGGSYEGFVIENILSLVGPLAESSFYRTAAGAELDLVLEFGGSTGTWVVEVKRSLDPSPTKGAYNAIEDIQPAAAFVIYPGAERYPISESIEAISLIEFMDLLGSISYKSLTVTG